MLDDFFLGDALLVYLDPLAEGIDMRRSEEASAIATVLEAGGCLQSNTAFAIGASDVHCAESILRIAKFSCQSCHTV